MVRAKHSTDPQIEEIRHSLLNDKTQIELTDFGAGSHLSKSNKRRINSVAKVSSSPPKFSAFLNELIRYFDYKEIVELGTSLGLNALYLSKSQEIQLTTFEGDTGLCRIAVNNFSKLKRENITIIEGNINETLPRFLNQAKSLDMVYLDANHRYKPTLDYFELCLPKMSKNGLIILDDIHWSKEMWKAWCKIKLKPQSILTIDLFEAGLIFLNPDIQPGDYTLTF